MDSKPPRATWNWAQCPYLVDSERYKLWCAIGYAVEIGVYAREDASGQHVRYCVGCGRTQLRSWIDAVFICIDCVKQGRRLPENGPVPRAANQFFRGFRAGDPRQRIDQQFAAPRSPRARIRQTVGIAPRPAPCRASVRHALICCSSIPIASAQGGHSVLDLSKPMMFRPWYRDSAPGGTCFRGLSCVISFCSRGANA